MTAGSEPVTQGRPLSGACCSVIDVYADAPAAQAALDASGMAGAVLSVADAHALGAELFGRLPAS